MNRAVRRARAEWGPLYGAVRRALVERGPRAVPMTLAAVCLTSVLHVVQNRSWGYRFVQDIGAVRAGDPLWLALVRTPLSLFVPALDLPVWGALAQILLALGVAEVCLGRWRTLAVGYAATLAGTAYARAGIALGPGSPLGLPAEDARVVDTGPSAAVVGLAVYLGWRHRAYVTAGAVVLAMVAEVLVKANLAGKEHLAAVAAVAALCGASEVRRRRRGADSPERRSPQRTRGAEP
ncbi:hypothetical protein ACH4F6_28885 [Streptomyces sp. NPDC017936]|uniref:hypothetical protein n=1 Tax=Streptomyces sp. NPDC017936 TaxID=3365016 RepID=UPI00379FB8F0